MKERLLVISGDVFPRAADLNGFDPRRDDAKVHVPGVPYRGFRSIMANIRTIRAQAARAGGHGSTERAATGPRNGRIVVKRRASSTERSPDPSSDVPVAPSAARSAILIA